MIVSPDDETRRFLCEALSFLVVIATGLILHFTYWPGYSLVGLALFLLVSGSVIFAGIYRGVSSRRISVLVVSSVLLVVVGVGIYAGLFVWSNSGFAVSREAFIDSYWAVVGYGIIVGAPLLGLLVVWVVVRRILRRLGKGVFDGR